MHIERQHLKEVKTTCFLANRIDEAKPSSRDGQRYLLRQHVGKVQRKVQKTKVQRKKFRHKVQRTVWATVRDGDFLET